MEGGPNPFANVHSDVLNANPEDAEGKSRLLNELKNRGKNAAKATRWPECELLYTKCTELAPSDATCWGNRSMALLKMGRAEGALSDADRALIEDPDWSKGYFRRGQALTALKRYRDAHRAFVAGGEKEGAGTSKAFAKAAAKALESAEKADADADVPPLEDATAKRLAAERVVERVEVKEEDVPTAATTATKGNAGAPKIRGYKLNAEGKKTTFFNHDQTEEERALIGDIAPKQVEAAAAGATADSGNSNVSAWNHAGTWEEKSLTPWSKQRLTEVLMAASFTIPDGSGFSIEVVDVKNLEGDAQKGVSRAKTWHMFEFSFDVEWELVLAHGAAQGTLKYVEVDNACDGDFEPPTCTTRNCPADARRLVDQYVKSSSAGLQAVVAERIASFTAEFTTK